MRKWLCVLLSVALFWAAVPPAPTLGENVNLLTNGDFETLMTDANGRTTAKDWGFWGKGWTDISKDNPQSGNTCVRIVNTDENRSPRISQTIETVTTGNTYTAFYHVRAPKSLSGNGAFSFNFQYYDAEGNELPLVSGKVLTAYPGTEWEKHEISFEVPENAVKLLVYLQLNSKGEVYVDNVFFGLAREASDFSIDSDAVFYYDDHASSPRVTVTDQGETGAAAVFTLKKGAEVIIPDTTAEFRNGKATFTFPLSKLSVYLEAYTVSVTVRKTSGAEEVLLRDVYKVKRPSRLAKDGTYYKKDGTPFTPVMAYHVDAPPPLALPSEDHYRKCKEMGINVVTLSHWYADYTKYEERLLPAIEKAKSYGLMVLVALYRQMLPGGHSYNIENTINVVKELADHETVFAFTLMDEPLLHDRATPESTMLPGYLAVRKYSESIPVLTVDFRGNVRDYKRVSNFSDIVMADAYPASVAEKGEQFSFVGKNVSMAIEAANCGERTVYSLVQAFNYSEYNYFPSASETLHFIYQSLFSGAKGVGYYSFSDADKTTAIIDGKEEEVPVPIFKDTTRWPEFKERGTGELPVVLAHFIENKGRNATDLSGDGYFARLWKDGEAEYLLLLNGENEEKTVTLPMKHAAFYAAPFGKEIAHGGTDGIFRYTLSAGEAVLLEITTDLQAKLYSAENEPKDALLSGEEMILEIKVPPREKPETFFVAIYGGTKENKELVALCSKEIGISESLTTEPISFSVPNVENPTYKILWWDTLSPKLNG